MKSKLFVLLLLGGIVPVCALRSETADSLRNGKTYPIGEVVVTGTRHETDVRHLPMTISVVGRQKIAEGFQPSLLPTLTEQIPGLFVTGRGIMGYGVSGGAAGQMTLRGVGGGPTTGLLVLIDGHPQYMGLMGHPIADACQSMLADRVEVVRGPASVLYGSNAMGGVIMDRSVFEILDAIGVNLLRLLIHDYLPQRFHAKQFYDLLINHHPLEYREMRNRYAHKPEQEIDGIVNAQISQYLLKRSSELNISKIENCYHKYTSHNNNSSQVSYWQHR